MSNAKFADSPGYHWRFNAPSNREKSAFKDVESDGKSCFDELVVDNWLHIEQMSDRVWWMRIGSDLNINITISDDGEPKIMIDDYEHDGKVAEMLSKDIIKSIIKRHTNA